MSLAVIQRRIGDVVVLDVMGRMRAEAGDNVVCDYVLGSLGPRQQRR